MSADNALLTLLTEKLRNNVLVLPTLPEIAVRVRQAADDPDINLHAMAEVIALDPALAARMLKVANSAFLGRSIKVNTLNQAVTRIGLFQVKNIATAMALEQLFVSQHPQVLEQMAELWRDTIEITCIAMACLKFYQQKHKHTPLNMDTMTLAALVYQIGALPILTEAEKYPAVFAEPAYLRHAIRDLSPNIGVVILQSWGFADIFVRVVQDWAGLAVADEPCYTDFVRLAAIARQQYPLRSNESQLLDNYLLQGLIPKRDFLQEPQIQQHYQDAKTMFM
ncbi:MAG: HDOD domain-containing protein [Rheinheimera sp.]|nr:HDOD domain-containing protein [Rheinheimera sp.]